MHNQEGVQLSSLHKELRLRVLKEGQSLQADERDFVSVAERDLDLVFEVLLSI